MKNGFIHICFVIDESGSMSTSIKDVVNGFNQLLKEQKEQNEGTCAISLYKFSSNVAEVFKGRDINDVKNMSSIEHDKFNIFKKLSEICDIFNSKNVSDDLLYIPMGGTAMNDGIGTAIDEIGKWLANMPEEERPEKNLIVIMTDGAENCSKHYTLSKVKEMIKHQTDVYSWSFMYIGTDVLNLDDANDLGIELQYANTRADFKNTYNLISKAATCYRTYDKGMSTSEKNIALNNTLFSFADEANKQYTEKTGIKL